jgi:hypothetical protein
MTTTPITKASAAQRQIDAAIRLLFSGEDSLAVHTVAAAGCGLIRDLANTIKPWLAGQEHRAALAGVYQGFLGRSPTEGEIHRDLPKLERLMRTARNRPVNFLKHADRDPNDLLNENDVKTDHLLLEACFLCASMGFDPTAEMRAFGRWHLAVSTAV